jgi:hypothetical protein
MTLRDAFAYFDGARGRNPRWSWSARSPDGRTVVLTLWEDHISDDGTTIRVDTFGRGQQRQWTSKLGNKERIENLVHARNHCGGLFRVVMITAKDRTARPRSIAKRYPHPTLVMKLTDFDETTGDFRAESVSR